MAATPSIVEFMAVQGQEGKIWLKDKQESKTPAHAKSVKTEIMFGSRRKCSKCIMSWSPVFLWAMVTVRHVSHGRVKLKPSGLRCHHQKWLAMSFRSGVKLLLYLADLCCLMCSPRSHFLSPSTTPASMHVLCYGVKTSWLPLFDNNRETGQPGCTRRACRSINLATKYSNGFSF